MTANYDFTPLYSSLIGADHLSGLVQRALRARAGGAVPFDVEKTADDGYRITLATPGFTPAELEVTAQANLLVIRGRKADGRPEATYLHRGLAVRSFEQGFELADHVVVTDARYADGVLTIDLMREVPDASKPRRIEINAPRAPSLPRIFDRRRRATLAA